MQDELERRAKELKANTPEAGLFGQWHLSEDLDLDLSSIIMTLNKPLTPQKYVFFFMCKTGVMTSALLDPEIPASLKEIMP